jgi:YHS domain-containing protein
MKSPTIRSGAIALAIATFSTLAIIPSTSFAYDKSSYAPINVDKHGIGLQGYDPVAYFNAGQPTKGKAEFQAAFEGVVYRFNSEENRALFISNPAGYAPEFGGFCAMGAALGKKLDVDPKAWHIADGKLYMNYNQDVQKSWLEDVPGNNQKAYSNWETISTQTPKSL